jgi:hypothetical protein
MSKIARYLGERLHDQRMLFDEEIDRSINVWRNGGTASYQVEGYCALAPWAGLAIGLHMQSSNGF